MKEEITPKRIQTSKIVSFYLLLFKNYFKKMKKKETISIKE